MRVALITSLEQGGPLDHSIVLAGALRQLGVEVTAVCATAESGQRFEKRGVRALVMPLRHRLDVRSAARVRRVTRDADVIHAQDRRSGLWTRLAPRRRGEPARVYTFHGLPDPYLPEAAGLPGPSLRDRLAYEWLDASLARRTSAVVVPSRFMARRVQERLRYPARRLVVIPNGIEPGQPVAPGRGSLVGTVSVLEPVKALDVFVDAAAELARERPELGFACFGQGSSRSHLAGLASSGALHDRLALPGHIPVAEALRQLRVFVLCSWTENSPLALMQAMAAGVPAVATAVGGVPEIADGVAELVPPGDSGALAAAVRRLLDDEEHATRLSRAARARVLERFTAERTAREHLELYERLR
jgi:glycosyltransferase involved in cell wall biosynthesis